ncbi:MAG: hypothetical protein KAY29_00815 [Brevundimonas sp.]|nr:hypothetical protein [Brevundimonas sp.]
MTVNAQASANAKVYIGPVTAAATVSAYAALTWVEIGGVESIGEFGDAAGQITFTGLSDGRVQKLKGAFDAGDIAVAAAWAPRDAGQIAARTAAGTKFDYAIKITLEDSPDANDTDSVFYFHAKVMSAKKAIGGANNILMENYNLAINTAIFASLSAPVS